MAGPSSLQYESPEEVAQRNAREARRAARVAKQNRHQESSSRYANNSSNSPQQRDEDLFRYQDLDEPYSPSPDGVLQEAVLVKQPQHQSPGRRGSAAYENNNSVPSTMPPGYPGPPMEDSHHHPPQQEKHRSYPSAPLSSSNRRQSGGGPSSYSSSRGAGPSSSSSDRDATNGHHPPRGPPAVDGPPSNGNTRVGGAQAQGATSPNRISRLESPSVMKSVLQPLEKKIGEYERLMAEARGEMTALDQEIRALQERRQQAEDRYLGSKAKHDDYSRQHGDVERAMRGEFDNYSPQQQQRNVAFADTGMSPATVAMPHLSPGAMRSAPSLLDDERPDSRHSEFEHKTRPRDRLRFSSLFRH